MFKLSGNFIFSNLILEDNSSLLVLGGGNFNNISTLNYNIQMKSILLYNSRLISSDVLQVNSPLIVSQIDNIFSKDNLLLDSSQLINISSSK